MPLLKAGNTSFVTHKLPVISMTIKPFLSLYPKTNIHMMHRLKSYILFDALQSNMLHEGNTQLQHSTADLGYFISTSITFCKTETFR